MAKHRIIIESVWHGALSCHHAGKDQAYCEAGEVVKVNNMPTAGWGLLECHYTDGDNNVVTIEGGEFEMPDSDIMIGGTFKRFDMKDWAGQTFPMPMKEVGEDMIVHPNIFYYFEGSGDLTLDLVGMGDGVFNEFVIFSEPSGKFNINTDGKISWAGGLTPKQDYGSIEEIHFFVVDGTIYGWFRDY